MVRGRPPKPVEVKRRAGNPGRRPLPDPVLIGGRSVPAAPDYLPVPARAIFREVAKDLHEAGILDRADRYAIARFALLTWMERQILAEQVPDGGSLKGLIEAETVRGKARSPWITSLLDTIRMGDAIGNRLGLDPSARARFGSTNRGTDEIERDLGPTPRQLRVVGGEDV